MIRAAQGIHTITPGTVRRSSTGRMLLLAMFFVLLIDNLPGFGIGIGPGLSAKNLFLYMLIILIGIRATANPNGVRFVDLNVHVPFLVLILYAILTWAVASIFDPTYNSIRGAMTLKNQMVDYYLFWFAFCYTVDRREDYLWLIRAIVIVMMFISAITLIDFLNIPDLGFVGTYRGRLEGPFGAANQYGALQAFLLPLAIALTPENSGNVRRWLWRAGILIIAALLIATGSRGAYLAMVVGPIMGAYFLRRHLDMRVVVRMAGIATVCGLFLLVLFAVFNYEFLAERFGKTTGTNIYTASSGRIEIWSAALGVMVEWPASFLVGYGWNAYEYSGIWKAAHNEYLDKLYELGVIGMTLFTVVLAAVPIAIRGALQHAPPLERRLLIAFVIAMLITFVDAFFVALPDTWPVIWIVAGLTCGLGNTIEKSAREQNELQK